MKPILTAILTSCVIALTTVVAAAAELRTMQAKPGSPAEIMAWQESLRAKFQKLLKIEDLVASDAKTPFDSQQIGVWDMGDYVVKKMALRSTPGRTITIFITLPKNSAGPHPAVVCTCWARRQGSDARHTTRMHAIETQPLKR